MAYVHVNYRLKRKVSTICREAITSKMFQVFMIMIVLLNSMQLAISDPSQPIAGFFQKSLEIAFMIAYFVEMVLKILAMGLVFYRNSYLRDPWNWLDMFVVFASAASLFGFSIGTSSDKPIYFSSLKIIGPLKTLNTFPKLKTLIRAIVDSIPALMEIILIIMMIFGVFAIVGVRLFSGSLSQRCMDLKLGKVSDKFDADLICGGTKQCQPGYACVRYGNNPVSGIFSFDNILEAYMTVFVITTLEGWSMVQYYLIQTYSWFVVIYVDIVVIIGAFILLNLALAIIVEKFTEIQEENEKNIDRNIRNLNGSEL